MMNRVLLALVASVFATIAACPAAVAEENEAAGQEAYREKQTGLVFPREVGDFKFETTREFEKPGLGVGIRYKLGEGTWADTIVYSFDLKEIPSDPSAEVVVRQADFAVSNIREVAERGYYPNLALVSREIVSLTGEKSGPKAHRVVFTFGPEGKQRRTDLYVLAYKNHFIKVRITSGANAGEAGVKQVEALMKWLGQQIQNGE